MDIPTLIASFKDILSTDETLRAWCMATYSSPPLICIGIDENNPPAREEYPVVVISEISDVSPGTRLNSYQVDFGVGVVDETIDFDEENNTKEYSGLANVITLMGLVCSAIRAARIGRVEFEKNTPAVIFYPVHLCYNQFTVEVIA